METAKSKSFISAYKKSAIKSMKADISEDDIIITDIKFSAGRRALLASGVVISSAVAVPNADPAALKSNLNTAITTGAFTQALVADGYPAASANAVATVVDTTSSAPTPSPKSDGKEEKNEKAFPAASIAGITVGLFCAVGITLGLVYYFVIRKTDDGKPWVAGSGGRRGSDKAEDFGRGPYNDDGRSQNILHLQNEEEDVK
jgi:hypothetical protein